MLMVAGVALLPICFLLGWGFHHAEGQALNESITESQAVEASMTRNQTCTASLECQGASPLMLHIIAWT